MLLGDSVLSMEPWEYPQWRDHWLQAVYLWPKPVQVQKGKGSCHYDILYMYMFRKVKTCVVQHTVHAQKG